MPDKIVSIGESITVGELAETLQIPVTTLIGELFKNGIVATINQRIDFETATIIVEELGIDASLEHKITDNSGEDNSSYELTENAVERPPIVTVMGHVDHGKTTLLDSILDTKATKTEAGGITQHISAYQTTRNGRKITLLDTPGHEAFAALRQHGATLTDVVIIVVAADDGVKPQTVEAIRFARSTNSKMVVAINKMDKESANPQLVKTQLASEHNLNPEEWGGDTIMVEVSAKTGKGVDKLLDSVLLVADLEELKADEGVTAQGLVIESHTEVGRGSVVSLLVEQGELKAGKYIVAGASFGKVRTMSDYAGNKISKAGPSTPVVVTGFKKLPLFGDKFSITKSDKLARQKAEKNRIKKEADAAITNVTGADLLKMMNQRSDSEEFNVIVKADVQGSLTSIVDSLKMIDTQGAVTLHVVGSGVGNITENDIRLASGDGDTVIYGFNVELPPAVKRLAARDHIEVRIYDVIYELLDDSRESMERLLSPEVIETRIGSLDIKGVFRTTKDRIIAGGKVTSGKVKAGLSAKASRKNEYLGELEVESVQRQQVEAKDVIEGEMCGLSLKTSKKIQLEEGDSLEFFTRDIVKRKLD